MKKLKLMKLMGLAPLVVVPLVANSCGLTPHSGTGFINDSSIGPSDSKWSNITSNSQKPSVLTPSGKAESNLTPAQGGGGTVGTGKFMPYYDVTLYDHSIYNAYKATGQSSYTLAFLNQDIYPSAGKSTPPNDPLVTWAGLDPNTPAYTAKDGLLATVDGGINSVRTATDNKAKIAVSVGGASGIPPWLWYNGKDMSPSNYPTTPTEVTAWAKKVAAQFITNQKKYNFVQWDFDIEGAAIGWSAGAYVQASANVLVQAIKMLKQQYSGINISMTLPVLGTGVTPADGVPYLNYLVKELGNTFVLNGMTMDYGASGYQKYLKDGKPIPNADYYAVVDAVNAYTKQYETALTNNNIKYDASDIMKDHIATTPMIGVNDYGTQVLTYNDAKMLLSWAQQKQLKYLSFWSTSRDHPGSSKTGLYATYGLNQSDGPEYVDYCYTNLWKHY